MDSTTASSTRRRYSSSPSRAGERETIWIEGSPSLVHLRMPSTGLCDHPDAVSWRILLLGPEEPRLPICRERPGRRSLGNLPHRRQDIRVVRAVEPGVGADDLSEYISIIIYINIKF